MPNAFLAADSTSSSTVKIKQNNNETISDIYKWEIRIATGGGCLIKSKYTGKYLYSVESSSSSSSVYVYGLYSSGSASYDKQRWRVVEPDEYKELTNGVSFDDLVLEIDSTKSPSVNKSPSDALWANLSDFTYTITSGNQYVLYSAEEHTFTGVSNGNAVIQAKHKVTGITKNFVIKVLKNAIIIVPGIMGSQIYAKSEIYIHGKTFAMGTRLWDPEIGFEILNTDEKVLALAMTSSGNPIYPTGVKNPIINYCTDNENECRYGAQNMYYEIYKKMYTDFYPKGYDIVLYEYDWRYDPYQTALLLNNFILEKGYGNIIFVAHSMGGIVTSYYLSLGEEQRDRVDKHISFGTPYLGSEKIACAYETGQILDGGFLMDMGNVILDGPVKEIIPNIPAVYTLFPFQKYFSPYLYCITNSIVPGNDSVNLYNNFQTTKSAIISTFHNINETMLNIALSNQTKLFIGDEHITKYVDSYYIMGDNISTIKGVGINMKNGELIEVKEYSETDDGDGTVSIHSATVGGTIDESRIFYFYDNNSWKLDASHVGLIRCDECDKPLQLVSAIINGTVTTSTSESVLSSQYGAYKTRQN